MAKRRKGVVPPQLRPYLFQKGGGRGKVRAAFASTGSSVRGGFRAMRSKAASMVSEVKHKWLEMLMAGAVGYLGPSQLSNLGLGWLAYNNVKPYATAIDQLYIASEKILPSSVPNPWRNGGLIGIGKAYGTVDAMNQVMKAAHSGKFGGGGLVKLGFDIGLIADGPEVWGASLSGTGGASW
jgi:hypothetical protein